MSSSTGGVGQRGRGVIYVLVNPCIQGLVKIGRTVLDAKNRARQLSHVSGVPVQFEVVYDAIVTNSEAAERFVHSMLEAQRVNPRREFFRVPLYDAIKAVRAAEERYPPNADGTDNEREILPELEQSMRRWLRHDLVSVRFVQYPDLCVLKVTTQPDPLSERAIEQIYDL